MQREIDAMMMILRGYRLTLAEITYYFPDNPRVINPNVFIWHDLDLAPRYPVLQRFLDFWQTNLDGKIHSVRVVTDRLIRPSEFRFPGISFSIN